MLVLQIAAGVVLAVLVVRFWRQSLVVAVVLGLLLTLVLFILWADRGRPANESVVHLVAGLLIAGAVIRWIVGKVQSSRASSIVDGSVGPPDQDSP